MTEILQGGSAKRLPPFDFAGEILHKNIDEHG